MGCNWHTNVYSNTKSNAREKTVKNAQGSRLFKPKVCNILNFQPTTKMWSSHFKTQFFWKFNQIVKMRLWANILVHQWKLHEMFQSHQLRLSSVSQIYLCLSDHLKGMIRKKGERGHQNSEQKKKRKKDTFMNKLKRSSTKVKIISWSKSFFPCTFILIYCSWILASCPLNLRTQPSLLPRIYNSSFPCPLISPYVKASGALYD